jgi:hypothetical protein
MLVAVAIILSFTLRPQADEAKTTSAHSYLGFDLNLYPGDAALPVLRKTFSFSSYWLSNPPGTKINSWRGKRELLRQQGFGFLVLYNGRVIRELRNKVSASQMGLSDAHAAAVAAKQEGFPAGTIIFVDIEEGGRLPANYHAYLAAWSAELKKSGYRSGAYCSGIAVKEEASVTIITADDIRNDPATKDTVIFAFNDTCPPSPGCVFPQDPPAPATSGVSYAAVWQFAQSPRRKDRTARCAPGYHPDGNCYAPGDASHSWFLDVNSATSADPSGGR